MKRVYVLLLMTILLFSGCGGAVGMQGDAERLCAFQSLYRCGDRLLVILNDGLYSTNLDGGNRKLIVDGCQDIVDLRQDAIVYIYQGAIHRVNWDGSGKKTLTGLTGDVYGCTNRWVYFKEYDVERLRRVSVDGLITEDVRGRYVFKVSPDKSEVLIVEADKDSSRLLLVKDDAPEPVTVWDRGVREACWCGGKLFIGAKESGLYRYDIAAGTVEKLSDDVAWRMEADGNTLYYLNGDTWLCSLDAEGSAPIALTKERISYDRAFNGDTKSYVPKDGWVYYRGGDTKLYRVSSDGKNTQRLTDTAVRPVAVQDGTIYYIEFTDKTEPGSDMLQYYYGSDVYRMNADGSGIKKFPLSKERIYGQLVMAGNRLYNKLHNQTEPPPEAWKVPKDGGRAEPQDYMQVRAKYVSRPQGTLRTDSLIFYLKTDARGIFCSNPDGSGEFLISKVFGWDYVYSDGWLYFHNHDGIYRVRRELGGEPALLVATDISEFTVCENKLLYLDNSGENKRGIYIAEADGTGLRLIVDRDNAMLIGAEDGWVYYSVGPYSLYRIRYDGSAEEALVQGLKEPIMHEALSDGYIYFHNGNSPGKFSRIDCNTGKIQALGTLYRYRGSFQFDEKYVYYIKDVNEGIWRMDKESLKEEQVVRGKASEFRLEGDMIYYIYEEGVDELVVVTLR